MEIKLQQTIFIAVFAIVIIAALILFDPVINPEKYDNFAKCLTEKNISFYGSVNCPHCYEQKEMFGDSFQYVTYVECSDPSGYGQTKECQDAGIQYYPSWGFPDGSFKIGKLSYDELELYSGCRLS